MTQFRFQPLDSYLTVSDKNFFSKDSNGQTESDRLSYLGTPVFSNLEIPSGNYKTLDGRTVDFEGLRVDSVLFVVSQQKNIVMTPIQGLDVTIKEYCGAGDYAITCTGIIVGQSAESARSFTVESIGADFPETDVRRLVEITKTPISIDIISDFLDLFEIRNVVIDSFTLGQSPGEQNSQSFELRMISDKPVELLEL